MAQVFKDGVRNLQKEIETLKHEETYLGHLGRLITETETATGEKKWLEYYTAIGSCDNSSSITVMHSSPPGPRMSGSPAHYITRAEDSPAYYVMMFAPRYIYQRSLINKDCQQDKIKQIWANGYEALTKKLPALSRVRLNKEGKGFHKPQKKALDFTFYNSFWEAVLVMLKAEDDLDLKSKGTGENNLDSEWLKYFNHLHVINLVFEDEIKTNDLYGLTQQLQFWKDLALKALVALLEVEGVIPLDVKVHSRKRKGEGDATPEANQALAYSPEINCNYVTGSFEDADSSEYDSEADSVSESE